MAMFARRSFYVSYFYFVHILFNVVLASQIVDEFHSNPSIFSIDQYEGSYFQNEDLFRTAYHIHKRSADSPSPVKKASTSLEKKFAPKDLSFVIDKFKSNVKKYSAENSTMTYTTDLPVTNSAHELYNLSSVTNPPVTLQSDVNSTVTPVTSTAASTTSTTSTTTSTASTTTASTTSASTVSTTPASSSVTMPVTDVFPTKPANITNTTEDYHVYYNSTFFSDREKAMEYWVNFDELPEHKVTFHKMLSDSHRRAATVTLSFDFPFYGHPLRNITIATGGFVYMGDYMHSWLAATQYIAPLMANFDTSLSEESTVRYFDNGTAFVIEWHEVSLQDVKTGGNFTFQTTLLNNGNIIFVYEVIPVSVTKIEDDEHPVKVGLSDAYVIDRILYFIRRKTIYEYHRIDMKKEEIANHTAIYFTALTTCLSFYDCTSCMTADVDSKCVWCESTKRCSDGLDRYRQDWLQSKCDVEKSSVNCSALPGPEVNPYVKPLTDSPSKIYTFSPRTKSDFLPEISTIPYIPDNNEGRNNGDNGASSSARVADDSSSIGVGSVVAILLILAIVMGSLVWVGYAYRNPHTSSGQLLIRYRPSQWRFRSGEARYTAASVHM